MTLPIQHRKRRKFSGHISHWWAMKRFDRKAERHARKREKEFQQLIKNAKVK